MDPGRFAALRRVVDGALALPADQRESFVKTECADDPELERRVLALLAHEKTQGPTMAGVFEDQVREAAASAFCANARKRGLADERRCHVQVDEPIQPQLEGVFRNCHIGAIGQQARLDPANCRGRSGRDAMVPPGGHDRFPQRVALLPAPQKYLVTALEAPPGARNQ